MSPYLTDYIRYVLAATQRFLGSGEQEIAAARQHDIAPYVKQRSSLCILDLANGHLRPQYMLLKAAGHKVYGLDLVNQPRLSWPNLGYAFARNIYA